MPEVTKVEEYTFSIFWQDRENPSPPVSSAI